MQRHEEDAVNHHMMARLGSHHECSGAVALCGRAVRYQLCVCSAVVRAAVWWWYAVVVCNGGGVQWQTVCSWVLQSRWFRVFV